MAFTFGAAPAAGGSSLFGAAPAQNNAPAAGSLFGGGQQQAQPGGNAGAQAGQAPNPFAKTGFSFGGPSASNPQPAAPGTSSLFGAPQQQQQQQQPAQQGSLFGNAPAASTGGLFGAPTAQPQGQTQGGGLFGNASTTQPQGGGLFGNNSTNQQPGGGLFGNNNTNQQPAASTSLFGSTNQQPNQQQNSLFNPTAPQSNSLFGSTAQSQQQPFSFNNAQQQQPQQQQMFASTSGAQNVLGSSMVGGNQRPEVDIGERMAAVQRAWDSTNPECRFKYYFYNVVEPGQAQQYGRPPGATDEGKWLKAVRENPDSTSMVPVIATGWADVKKRSQMQEQIASVHQHKIKEISQALTTLSRQSNLTTSIRLSALQTHLTQLQHRLIRLAAQSPAFIPSLQSSALRPEELETKKTLEVVKAELDGKKAVAGPIKYGLGAGGTSTPKKGSGTRMMGQVNELWGQVEEIRRYRGKRVDGGEKEGWLSDERVLGEVAEVLATQQMALQKLNDLASNAVFDADVMRQALGLISPHERHAS